MVSFNVEISPTALKQLNSYIDYIHYTLLNDDAADRVLLDALDTVTELQSVAGSLRYCDHPELRKRGIKKIQFLKHDYIMLYAITGSTVEIKAIYKSVKENSSNVSRSFKGFQVTRVRGSIYLVNKSAVTKSEIITSTNGDTYQI